MPLLDSLQERTAALVAPIAGGAGADVTFEPDFETLKKEIDKLSSVDAKPDWKVVTSGATQILTHKSKDMRVAIWNTVGLVQASGFQGFAEGLVVLHKLVTEYWDTMFPDAKRGRARSNLVGWLVDQSVKALEKTEVDRRNGEAVKVSDDMLNGIDAVLSAKLGELYTGLGQLRGLMRDKVRQIPVEAPAATDGGGATTTETTSAEAASPAGVQLPVATGAHDADAPLSFHGQAIVEVGHVLRVEDPTSGAGYRLVRLGAWLQVLMLPPNENKTTMVPSPGDLSGYQAQIDAGSFLETVHQCEAQLPNALFALDLHRYASTALERLGPTHEAARVAVGRELVAFLSRLPGIEELKFGDGVPFADAATRTWIDEQRALYGGGGGGPSKSALVVDAEEQEVKARFEEARAMVTGGQVPDGLRLGVQLAARAVDARSRFRARLAVAQMALDAGRRELARPMLEALLIEVDQHHLETWEPGLCVPLYSTLLGCLRHGRGNDEVPPPDVLARETYVFDKLCRLDPAAALKATGG